MRLRLAAVGWNAVVSNRRVAGGIGTVGDKGIVFYTSNIYTVVGNRIRGSSFQGHGGCNFRRLAPLNSFPRDGSAVTAFLTSRATKLTLCSLSTGGTGVRRRRKAVTRSSILRFPMWKTLCQRIEVRFLDHVCWRVGSEGAVRTTHGRRGHIIARTLHPYSGIAVPVGGFGTQAVQDSVIVAPQARFHDSARSIPEWKITPTRARLQEVPVSVEAAAPTIRRFMPLLALVVVSPKT